MANDKAIKSAELYKQGIPLVDIAKILGVSAGTVRSWKNRHCWDNESATPTNATQHRRNVATKTQRNITTASIDKKLVEAVEENTELTDARKAFCLHYVKTFNATASYLRAYPNCSYETAGTNGWVLLQKTVIRDEIQRLKQMRNLHLMASGDDVVEKYMHIAFADITDYLEFGRVEVGVMGAFGPVMIPDSENPDSKGIPLTKEINEVRFKDSSAVDGTLISEVKQGKDGASIKLADRMKALEWLARYFTINPLDKHKMTYDNVRLDIEQKSLKLQEDKVHGITTDIDEIKEGLQGLMDVVASPVPNRSISDE